MSQVIMRWAVAETTVESYELVGTSRAQWDAHGSYDALPSLTAEEQAELQNWGTENERLAQMLTDEMLRAGLANAAQRRLNTAR